MNGTEFTILVIFFVYCSFCLAYEIYLRVSRSKQETDEINEIDTRIEQLEDRVKALRNETKGIEFTNDQISALVALLTLVHYDDLAQSYFDMLPNEIKSAVNEWRRDVTHG